MCYAEIMRRLDAARNTDRALRVALAGRMQKNWFRVLSYLSVEDATSATQIADALDIAQSNVSMALNSLVRLGYVERRKSSEDRRAIAITATEAGLEAHKQALTAVGKALEAG